MIPARLFKPVDIAPLAIFRMLFGFLLFAETFGAILTGWVRINLITPEFTFSHIGLDWLQPLPGIGMYVYFLTMALAGIGVMLGFRYRWSLGLFTILWAGAYLMQKESYNNHYYLLLLVCLLMLVMPAGSYASLDVRRNPSLQKESMPDWCRWLMISQVTIVYFFATLAKFYPDWLDGTFIRILLFPKQHYPIVGQFFAERWFHLFIAWSGLFFDATVVVLLLFKRTRTVALVLSLLFHLFNSMVLQIGIFPFFALSFVLFFYPADAIRKRFFPKKQPVAKDAAPDFTTLPTVRYLVIPYLTLQLVLPIRHYFIPGDVLWTEEGHRLSWRMMLRQRSGSTQYWVEDRKTGQRSMYPLRNLDAKQRDFASSKPDGIWQMARRIRLEEEAKGHDVAVYVQSHVAVNAGPYRKFVKDDVDVSRADFGYFTHADWILLHDEASIPNPANPY